MPVSSEGERNLRAVLDMLLQDVALEPVDPAALPWDQPVFVLRSTPMHDFAPLVDTIRAQAPAAPLHILSHARDGKAIAAIAPGATFHAYPAPGRYRLEEIPAAMLHRLRQAGFGMLVFPDPETSAELWDEVERIFGAIDGDRMVVYTRNGHFARPADWGRRRRAQGAFLQLVEWYQSRAESAESIASNQDASRNPGPVRATNEKS